MSAIVRTVAIEAGLAGQVWSHLFRHTRLTSLLNEGMSIQETARFAGHTSINTTLHYFHEDERRLKEGFDRATGKQEDAV